MREKGCVVKLKRSYTEPPGAALLADLYKVPPEQAISELSKFSPLPGGIQDLPGGKELRRLGWRAFHRNNKTMIAKYALAFALLTHRTKAAGQVTQRDRLELRQLHASLLYELVGRPCWYIDPQIIPFLESVNLDVHTEELYLPKGVLLFCFPMGYEVEGFPCKNVMLYRPLTKEMKTPICQISMGIDGYEIAEREGLLNQHTRLSGAADVGCTDDDRYSWNEPSVAAMYFELHVNKGEQLDEAIRSAIDSATAEEGVTTTGPAVRASIHMAAACMAYTRARPEVLSPHRLSRKNKKVRARPGAKYVQPIAQLPKPLDVHDENATYNESGRRVRPHIRGSHIRYLRHERFKRNDDGSVRTVLVLDSLINAANISDISTKDPGAVVK